MKITVLYDNEIQKKGLRADWGFSALVESGGMSPVLFDTGADGAMLLHNMNELGVDPADIGVIVISHAHWDHTGGLSEVLDRNRTAELYIPTSFRSTFPGRKVTVVGKDSVRIRENVFSTGELEGVEQCLVLKTDKGVCVVTGCAHPGMRGILEAASRFGRIRGIVGGFHGFRDFELFQGLSLICPCHCTQRKSEILERFKGRALECGSGLVLEL